MAEVEIVNPVPVDEVRGWAATLRSTFLEPVDQESLDRSASRFARTWDESRHWAARAEGRWVATLCTYDRTITVPGAGTTTADLGADALSAVTVNATHRRRGLLRAMLGSALDAAKERGDAVSVLFAAEWPIYGRFGYAPATLEGWYRYRPRVRGGALQPSGNGRLRQVELSELATLAPPLFDAARRRQAGQIDRPGGWWGRATGTGGYPSPDPPATTQVVHEGPDGVDGLVVWTPTRQDSFDGTLGAIDVRDLVCASADAYRDLWAYLGAIDLIDEVTLVRRPVFEPVRWLLEDGRALQQYHTGDGMWLRLLDVPAALTARGYATEAQVVLDVVDADYGGYATGRFLVEAAGDGSSCLPTRTTAELRVGQRALASAYLGAFSFRELAIGGGVEELVPGAVARADALFATAVAPWNQTMF